MSFGRHAYRHAVQPSSCLADHVWISEDFLTSTFRRFVNSQRRYESRVPGPLEARRRLAKRRNTALAGIAGSGPLDDIACLFGRNGREHMKWTDGRGQKSSIEAPDSRFLPSKTTATPVCFDNENLNQIEFGIPPSWPGIGDTPGKVSRDEVVGEQLREQQTASGFRDVVRELKIDLQRQPAYSRLMFDHLILWSAGNEMAAEELVLFLEDPYLNIRGASNYLGLVEHFVSSRACPDRRPSLGAVLRALELGLVPSEELCAIVKALSRVSRKENHMGKQHGKLPRTFFQDMWDAIGRCDIYRHKDLDTATIDTWLGVLWENNTSHDRALAKDIILAVPNVNSSASSWITKFIIQWLETPQKLRSKSYRDYASKLLGRWDPDTTSSVIISVTEHLVSAKNRHMLERWRACLAGLQHIPAIVSSNVWIKARAGPVTASSGAGLSHQHQIIVRLWLLRTFSKCLAEGPLWRRGSRATDSAILTLFKLYESSGGRKTQDFLGSLMKGIHELDMPPNGLLLSAADLKAGKSMTKTTRQTLKRLESSGVCFSDIFADLNAYNSALPHFYSKFEQMVRQIDITNPGFIQHGVQLARTGNTKDVWNLIRLLRSHTPLKIALAKSWQPIPKPSEKVLVRYYSEPRTAGCPEPHAALEMINLLAISFSCSQHLSPRRAFELVRWLYRFLLRHNAPVRPALVRALYHAGVVRFRRDGRRVSPTQYAYICDIVKTVEGPEVVKALMDPFRIGASLPTPSGDLDKI